MNGSEILIPIVFFLTIAGVWGGLILTRHKERMTMLDKGLAPADIKQLYQRSAMQTSPYASLKWGIVFVAIGLAVLVGMWLRNMFYVDEGIFPALIALFGGVGLIAFYATVRKRMVE